MTVTIEHLKAQHDLDRTWVDGIEQTLADHAARIDDGKEGRLHLRKDMSNAMQTIAKNDSSMRKTLGENDTELKNLIGSKIKAQDKHLELITHNLDRSLREETQNKFRELRHELASAQTPAGATSGDAKFLTLQVTARLESLDISFGELAGNVAQQAAKQDKVG